MCLTISFPSIAHVKILLRLIATFSANFAKERQADRARTTNLVQLEYVRIDLRGTDVLVSTEGAFCRSLATLGVMSVILRVLSRPYNALEV